MPPLSKSIFCALFFRKSVFTRFVESAPTSYSAPKWPDPDGISAKNAKKNTPRPEILDSQNLPPKYLENTEKIPPKYQKCVFWGYFSVFWGYFPGVPEFQPGAIFSVFFVEIPGRAISGLCSRSGRSLLDLDVCAHFLLYFGISKPMVCQTYGFHAGGLSRNVGSSRVPR